MRIRAGLRGPAMRVPSPASSSTGTVAAPNARLEHGPSESSELAPALNAGRSAQGLGAVSTSNAESYARGSAGTPYHPLAEHFSYYGGDNDMDSALQDRYAPLYGMSDIYPGHQEVCDMICGLTIGDQAILEEFLS